MRVISSVDVLFLLCLWMGVFMYCDPYLNREDMLIHPLLEACNDIWHQYGNISHVCNLHHSSRQRRILNPLSKGRDRTRYLMVPSQIRLPLCHNGTPLQENLKNHLDSLHWENFSAVIPSCWILNAPLSFHSSS